MSDQEFVILLGDEPSEKAAEVNTDQPLKDDGFVILLGEHGPGDDAADNAVQNDSASSEDNGFVVLLDEPSADIEALRIDGQKAWLGSELGVAQVAEVYQQLAEWLSETSGELTISLASCDYLDSAGWQLLGLFKQKMQQLGRHLRIEDIAESLYGDYQRYGVDGILPGLEASAA